MLFSVDGGTLVSVGEVHGVSHEPAMVSATVLQERDGISNVVVPLLERVIYADPCDGVVDAVFDLLRALLYEGCASSATVVNTLQTQESNLLNSTSYECEECKVHELLLRVVSNFKRTRPAVVLHALDVLSGYAYGNTMDDDIFNRDGRNAGMLMECGGLPVLAEVVRIFARNGGKGWTPDVAEEGLVHRTPFSSPAMGPSSRQWPAHREPAGRNRTASADKVAEFKTQVAEGPGGDIDKSDAVEERIQSGTTTGPAHDRPAGVKDPVEGWKAISRRLFDERLESLFGIEESGGDGDECQRRRRRRSNEKATAVETVATAVVEELDSEATTAVRVVNRDDSFQHAGENLLSMTLKLLKRMLKLAQYPTWCYDVDHATKVGLTKAIATIALNKYDNNGEQLFTEEQQRRALKILGILSNLNDEALRILRETEEEKFPEASSMTTTLIVHEHATAAEPRRIGITGGAEDGQHENKYGEFGTRLKYTSMRLEICMWIKFHTALKFQTIKYILTGVHSYLRNTLPRKKYSSPSESQKMDKEGDNDNGTRRPDHFHFRTRYDDRLTASDVGVMLRMAAMSSLHLTRDGCNDDSQFNLLHNDPAPSAELEPSAVAQDIADYISFITKCKCRRNGDNACRAGGMCPQRMPFLNNKDRRCSFGRVLSQLSCGAPLICELDSWTTEPRDEMMGALASLSCLALSRTMPKREIQVWWRRVNSQAAARLLFAAKAVGSQELGDELGTGPTKKVVDLVHMLACLTFKRPDPEGCHMECFDGRRAALELLHVVLRVFFNDNPDDVATCSEAFWLDFSKTYALQPEMLLWIEDVLVRKDYRPGDPRIPDAAMLAVRSFAKLVNALYQTMKLENLRFISKVGKAFSLGFAKHFVDRVWPNETLAVKQSHVNECESARLRVIKIQADITREAVEHEVRAGATGTATVEKVIEKGKGPGSALRRVSFQSPAPMRCITRSRKQKSGEPLVEGPDSAPREDSFFSPLARTSSGKRRRALDVAVAAAVPTPAEGGELGGGTVGRKALRRRLRSSSFGVLGDGGDAKERARFEGEGYALRSRC